LIVDRTKFDKFLFDKAIEKGAIPHLNEKFITYKQENNVYKLKTSKGTYNTHMIVGADGPLSSVAKESNILNKRNMITGLQSRCNYKDLEEGTTTIHLDKGDFSWVIPEDDKIARVGVLGKASKQLYKDYKMLLGKNKIVQNISGAIPLYDPTQKLRKPDENIFLMGDSATQLKATTYGGIVFGLNAGKLLADNKETYVDKFNKEFGKELILSLKMRKLMNCMSEKQKNRMVHIFSSKHNKKILSKYDRDYPSKFLFKMVLSDPRIMAFGANLLSKYIKKPKQL